ncbi:hypothetical protein HK097_005469 [Rhizophlyctis rosea]|uniref:Uncharacterized protein n=1 Tax=Rhizophlyctis rosea TaxID=64517 RepID=A0AAD5S0F9_9FUNG|nr:hypothetical protein HK097_005469 [Rhizophlyctis rosea]
MPSSRAVDIDAADGYETFLRDRKFQLVLFLEAVEAAGVVGKINERVDFYDRSLKFASKNGEPTVKFNALKALETLKAERNHKSFKDHCLALKQRQSTQQSDTEPSGTESPSDELPSAEPPGSERFAGSDPDVDIMTVSSHAAAAMEGVKLLYVDCDDIQEKSEICQLLMASRVLGRVVIYVNSGDDAVPLIKAMDKVAQPYAVMTEDDDVDSADEFRNGEAKC